VAATVCRVIVSASARETIGCTRLRELASLPQSHLLLRSSLA